MIVPLPHPVQLNRHRNPGSHPRRDPEKQSQPQPVPDTEHNRVRHHPREHAQRPMLPAQQIVSQIQPAKYIQANASETDTRDDVVIQINRL
jgi:hypothetical protein